MGKIITSKNATDIKKGSELEVQLQGNEFTTTYNALEDGQQGCNTLIVLESVQFQQISMKIIILDLTRDRVQFSGKIDGSPLLHGIAVLVKHLRAHLINATVTKKKIETSVGMITIEKQKQSRSITIQLDDGFFTKLQRKYIGDPVKRLLKILLVIEVVLGVTNGASKIILQQATKQAAKEASKVLSQQTIKEVVEEASKAVGQQATKEAAKEAGKAVGQQATKEVAKEAGKAASQQATKEAAKEAGKVVSQQAIKEVVEETSKAVGQQVTKDVAKEAGKAAGKQVTEDGTKTIVKEITQVTQEAAQNVSRCREALKETAKTTAMFGAVLDGAILTYNIINLWYNDKERSTEEKKVESWRLTGAAIGSTAGSTAGAVLGQIAIPVPVVSPMVGGMVGSIASSYFGGRSFEAIGSSLHSESTD